MEKIFGQTKLVLERGDITKLGTDAIVNAANPFLAGGGGVDGDIHRVGGPSILRECRGIIAKIGKLEPGRAVLTTGGNLPAKYVIHTVGPIWRGNPETAQRILAAAYTNSLAMADKMALKTMAFPSISTGAYGYPLAEAAKVALTTIKTYLEGTTHLQQVVVVLFSKEDLAAYEGALNGL